jgi:hypothetical protein
MAFVHERSYDCAKSELDPLSIPATELSIESGNYVEYHPISSITGGASMEFDVTASGDACLDLANSFLCVRAKITRLNNDDLNAADMVGPVNNFLHNCLPKRRVVNGTLITSSTNIYAYRAYIETLLSCSHRRRVCGIREHVQNRPKMQRRIRLQLR